jgi:hypothetical protein
VVNVLLLFPSAEPPNKRLLSDGGLKRLVSEGGLNGLGLPNAVGLGAEIFRFDGGCGVTGLQKCKKKLDVLGTSQKNKQFF